MERHCAFSCFLLLYACKQPAVVAQHPHFWYEGGRLPEVLSIGHAMLTHFHTSSRYIVMAHILAEGCLAQYDSAESFWRGEKFDLLQDKYVKGTPGDS